MFSAGFLLAILVPAAPAQEAVIPDLDGAVMDDWRKATLMDYFFALPFDVLPLSPLERAEAFKDGQVKHHDQRADLLMDGDVILKVDKLQCRLDCNGNIGDVYWFKLYLVEKGADGSFGPMRLLDLKYSARGWEYRRPPPPGPKPHG